MIDQTSPQGLTHAEARALFDSVFALASRTQGECVISLSGDDGGARMMIDATYPLLLQQTNQGDVIGVALTRSGDSFTVQHISAAGLPIPRPSKQYFDGHPVFGQVCDQMLDGQHMVKIPKFYVRGTTLTDGPLSGSQSWFISPDPREGFHLHSAFRSYTHPDGAPYFLVGKYQASLELGAIASRPSIKPAVCATLDDFRSAAEHRNKNGRTGWQVWTARQGSAIDWLYLIENASFDSRSATGPGRTEAGSAEVVDALDVVEASYRGITGLWGNVWQWVDGLQIKDGRLYVEDNGTWARLDAVPQTGGWHPIKFAAPELSDDLFIATECGADEDEAICPCIHYYSDSEEPRLAMRGGYWSYGVYAGVFALYLSYARSYSGTYIGSRPAFVI